jgi:hypothetical protein
MTPLGEDYTAGILAGVPIFCINRHYVTGVPTTMHKIQYIYLNLETDMVLAL